MSEPFPIRTVHTVADLRAAVSGWKAEGETVGFVPTMGALHAGHISLIDIAKSRAAKTVASVFVNPKQFAPNEDFGAYPRTLPDDARKLAEAGCDLLYAPNGPEMYPDGFAASVHVGGPSEGLETDFRPHFFDGVATVVTKLFTQVRPDIAVFGEKDYQQLLVVKRLAADLDLGVEIVPGPVMREADGLAMSSRNVYLSAEERERAVRLNALLFACAEALEKGERIADTLKTARIVAESAFDLVDYVDVRCANTLAALPGPVLDRPARVLAAVKLGSTRLIDNVAADPR
ncbi:MAG: pantoate--beta-alanine ligase [Alphaproteobacteria bacterium]|nr:pantoate--beta-alanine ligase [Alphaproteobacteria bacterium]